MSADDLTALKVHDLVADSAVSLVDAPDQSAERFKLEYLDDLEAEPEPTFALQGLLKRGDLAVFYGAAKSFKTYVALDMAMSLAQGRGIGERRYFAGKFEILESWRTVYITNEGRSFLRYRLRACFDFHEASLADQRRLPVIRDVPNLFTGSGVPELIDRLRSEAVDMIVFDTFARCTVGIDENPTTDMGVVLDNIQRIQEALGGPCILFLHHANKEGGMRGSTALQGAADVIVKFAMDRGSGFATIKSDGMKDAAEFDKVGFRTTQFGDNLRYRVVDWTGPDQPQSDAKQELRQYNRRLITAHIREHCTGRDHAQTVPEIAAAVDISATTVRDHLTKAGMDNDRSDRPVNGFRKTTKKKADKLHPHYFWDPNFKDEVM